MRSILLLLFLGACGGKIVTDVASIDEPRTPVEEPMAEERRVEEQPPVVVTPAAHTSLDACIVLCERDARCDTTLPALPTRDGEGGDCAARCATRLAGKCGIGDWLLCYAAHIEPNTCTPLPDECRPAFCAWATCTRQPVSICQ